MPLHHRKRGGVKEGAPRHLRAGAVQLPITSSVPARSVSLSLVSSSAAVSRTQADVKLLEERGYEA
jgi:hypothetical protein